MKKKTSKITKKGDWTFTKVAALILILITLVVVILAIFPGLRDPLGSLGVLIKGYTDSFKEFRSKPDSVKTQEEATEFNNRITRILEGSGTCEGYKEVQIIYSKAKRIGKQEPPTWEVCTQNKQGNVLTTDTNKYCDKISDAPKQEVSYFKQYIQCLIKGRDSTLETCQQADTEADKFLQNNGRYNPQSVFAKENPHEVYVAVGDCYFRIGTQQSLVKAKATYEKYQTYAKNNGAVSNPATQSQVQTKIQELEQQTNPNLWETVKKEYQGDPEADFNKALGDYRAKNYVFAEQEFKDLVVQSASVSTESTALKQIVANSVYFIGTSQRLQNGVDSQAVCDKLTTSTDIITLDYPGSTFLSQTEMVGPIKPQALYETAHCFKELPSLDAQEKSQKYYILLLESLNFNRDDPLIQNAIKDLDPHCNTIEQNSAMFEDEGNCLAQNDYLRNKIPATSPLRKNLFCYWDTNTPFYTDGICQACSHIGAPQADSSSTNSDYTYNSAC